MSRYTPVQLGPTEGQLSDLAEGNAVHLSPAHMKGDVTFHLTKAQVDRINKAIEAGRGCKLTLSKAQIKHSMQHGSGRFTDLLKSGARAGFDALKPVIKTGLGKALDYGADKAKHFIADKISSKIDGAGLYLSGGALSPTEMGQLRRMHKMHGSGFFGNILKTLGHGGVDLLSTLVGGGIGHPTPTQFRQLKAMHDKHGSGLLDFLGSLFGGGVKPHTCPQCGQGFFGDVMKKLGHGAVDFVGDKIGFGIHPQCGQGFFGDVMKKLGHGAVDFVGDKIGFGVNPLANPNEALRAAIFQKKAPVRPGSAF